MTTPLFSWVFGGLVFATVLTEALLAKYQSAELLTVKTRIRTWWWISLTLIGTVLLGKIALQALLVFFLFQSLRELRSLPVQTGSRTLIQLYGLVVLPAGLLSVAMIAESLEEWQVPLLLIFFLTALNDIFQYLGGKALGKTRLAPTLSPKKTFEGLLGGVLATAMIAVLVLPLGFALSPLECALLGALIALFGTLGDLSVSALKRRANVKDTGNFLPGHGGLLDRLDSLLAVSPFILAWIRFKFHGAL